jgi:hypothetical protein
MSLGGNAHSVYTYTDRVPGNNPGQTPSRYWTINPMNAEDHVTVRLKSTLSSIRNFPAVAVSADSSGTECVLHNCVMSSAVLTVQMDKYKIRFL